MKKEFKIEKDGKTSGKVTIISKPELPFNREAKIKFYQSLGYTVFDMKDKEIKA